MNNWALGPLNGAARIFIQSSNPAEVLAQMGEGETISPVPLEVANGPLTVILRANMQYDLEDNPNG